MRRFFNRNDVSDLESQLRDGRPEPPAQLLDQLVSRVEPASTSRPASRPRFAAALVFAVVVLVALAAFGGVGYAASCITSAAKNSQRAVASVVKQGGNKQQNTNDNKSNKNDNKNNKNNGQNHHEDEHHGDNHHGDHHHPPWVHQYSHFVIICYHNHTIIVPRAILGYLGPYTLGPCRRS